MDKLIGWRINHHLLEGLIQNVVWGALERFWHNHPALGWGGGLVTLANRSPIALLRGYIVG